MHTQLAISENKKEKEISIIKQIAMENRYSQELINCLNDHTYKRKKPDTTNKKWATFIYFNPKVRIITNIFKDTQLRTAF
jgi:hypothetical protein